MPRYYFDWASTAMPADSHPDASLHFGNPSSLHHEGRLAREALESARGRCAAVLNVPPETLYFTSGGTESNCIVLFSYINRQGAGRITASVGEHSSITENLKILDRLGRQTGNIPIDPLGRVTESVLSKTLTQYGNVRFTAIMAVNNETGTINDIAGLRKMTANKEPPVHFHCDMVQAVGKIPVDIAGWGIDSASFSAHKIGGPRGIGLLYLRKPLEVLYSGGGQERNIRPGTENVSGALAIASCLENRALPETTAAEYAKAEARCKRLLCALKEIDRCRIIPAGREVDDPGFSPYIVQAAFRDIPGEVMTRALDDLGFAVSTGSACSSARPERPVLSAMGIDDKLGLEGIRISQGWSTTDEEIDLLLEAVREVLKFL
ncbi:MAG: cysteine desulfurase [Treponema sp.]|jgi:cysteine desulfurase|nr:cysteine desulfurase [Treponema sp.]